MEADVATANPLELSSKKKMFPSFVQEENSLLEDVEKEGNVALANKTRNVLKFTRQLNYVQALVDEDLKCLELGTIPSNPVSVKTWTLANEESRIKNQELTVDNGLKIRIEIKQKDIENCKSRISRSIVGLSTRFPAELYGRFWEHYCKVLNGSSGVAGVTQPTVSVPTKPSTSDNAPILIEIGRLKDPAVLDAARWVGMLAPWLLKKGLKLEFDCIDDYDREDGVAVEGGKAGNPKLNERQLLKCLALMYLKLPANKFLQFCVHYHIAVVNCFDDIESLEVVDDRSRQISSRDRLPIRRRPGSPLKWGAGDATHCAPLFTRLSDARTVSNEGVRTPDYRRQREDGFKEKQLDNIVVWDHGKINDSPVSFSGNVRDGRESGTSGPDHLQLLHPQARASVSSSSATPLFTRLSDTRNSYNHSVEGFSQKASNSLYDKTDVSRPERAIDSGTTQCKTGTSTSGLQSKFNIGSDVDYKSSKLPVDNDSLIFERMHKLEKVSKEIEKLMRGGNVEDELLNLRLMHGKVGEPTTSTQSSRSFHEHKSQLLHDDLTSERRPDSTSERRPDSMSERRPDSTSERHPDSTSERRPNSTSDRRSNLTNALQHENLRDAEYCIPNSQSWNKPEALNRPLGPVPTSSIMAPKSISEVYPDEKTLLLTAINNANSMLATVQALNVSAGSLDLPIRNKFVVIEQPEQTNLMPSSLQNNTVAVSTSNSKLSPLVNSVDPTRNPKNRNNSDSRHAPLRGQSVGSDFSSPKKTFPVRSTPARYDDSQQPLPSKQNDVPPSDLLRPNQGSENYSNSRSLDRGIDSGLKTELSMIQQISDLNSKLGMMTNPQLTLQPISRTDDLTGSLQQPELDSRSDFVKLENESEGCRDVLPGKHRADDKGHRRLEPKSSGSVRCESRFDQYRSNESPEHRTEEYLDPERDKHRSRPSSRSRCRERRFDDYPDTLLPERITEVYLGDQRSKHRRLSGSLQSEHRVDGYVDSMHFDQSDKYLAKRDNRKSRSSSRRGDDRLDHERSDHPVRRERRFDDYPDTLPLERRTEDYLGDQRFKRQRLSGSLQSEHRVDGYVDCMHFDQSDKYLAKRDKRRSRSSSQRRDDCLDRERSDHPVRRERRFDDYPDTLRRERESDKPSAI